MPAPVKVPAYRFHRATGQALVVINGDWHYLGKHDTPESRERYDRLIAEYLSHGRALRKDHDMSIVEVLAAYWDHAEQYYQRDGQPTQELETIRIGLRPLRRLYGETPAKDFGPRALVAIRQTWIDSKLSRKTSNYYTGIVKRVFAWAVAQELVPPSIHHGLSAVHGLRRGRSTARETLPVKPVPEEFVDAIQPFVSRHVWAMIELQRLTGMRSGEVCIMRARDINMSGSLWEYRPERHKTDWHDHERIVTLGPKAQAIVRAFLSTDVNAYLFSPIAAEAERRARLSAARKTKLTYGNRPGTNRKLKRRVELGDHYTSCSYRAAIRRGIANANRVGQQAAAKAGQEYAAIPDWHPHQLRHNYATMIRRRFGIEAAQILLGHATMDATAIYAERNSQVALRIAADVG